MLTAGIDVGAKTVKIVVAEDGKIADYVITPRARTRRRPLRRPGKN